ncbi:MAG: cell division protein FtsH, partial [Deinococcota bacterium]|nr:cell division protein FtsH [Deinococcota bacterium]
ITAYHEAGHAVSYVAQPDLGRARKVTIMPRGGAGGFMAPLSKERMYYEKDLFKQQLLVAFAGRIAEKKLTGTVSSGAASDLKQATDIAKQMVFDFGMGAEEFIAWGSDSGPVFLGGEISRRKDFSETTARQLEEEVNAILREAYERTEHLVEENWVAVTSVAEALLVQETLDGSLIERAYAMAQEGRSAEDITETILKEAKAAEEAIEEASQRAAEEAEARRRKTIDSERKLKPKIVEPRPAHKGSSG